MALLNDAVLQAEAIELKDRRGRLAKSYMLKARIQVSRFEVDAAVEAYEKAVDADPAQVENQIELAEYLQQLNRLQAAEQGYKQIVATAGIVDPLRAGTLNNLGILYDDTGRPKEAEASYAEALEIQRALVAKQPETYRPDLAMTLNNLGNLYKNTGRPEEAEASYTEALETRRVLAAKQPETYRPYVATTLNNLGILYGDTGRPREAEASYAGALEIQRVLAVGQPETYRPDLAMTLNNLGNLYKNTGRPKEAEATYTEALAVIEALPSDIRATPAPTRICRSAARELALLLHERGETEKAKSIVAKYLPGPNED